MKAVKNSTKKNESIQKFFNKIRQFKQRVRRKLNKNKKLKVFLKVLLILMFLVGLYLIIYPFLPRLLFFLNNEDTYPYKTNLEGIGEGSFEGKDLPEENRLVIPRISVDMPIVEGNGEWVLDLGVWHRPGTGIPGSGNMVLTGHRVGYAFLPEDVKNSTSFYNLDKLENGDYVIVYWEGKEYDYEIYGSSIVEPSYSEVESQEGVEHLTLYTCHPIGIADKRLVYFASPFDLGE